MYLNTVIEEKNYFYSNLGICMMHSRDKQENKKFCVIFP